VQPFHRTEQPYEQLSVLFNLVGLMAVPLGPRGGACGPAMVTSRSDYGRIGGHAPVAGKVVEDWFSAHRYEAAGLPVSAFLGHGSLAYRMYPGGLRPMVVGFDKNFATAAGEVRWPEPSELVSSAGQQGAITGHPQIPGPTATLQQANEAVGGIDQQPRPTSLQGDALAH